MKIIFVINSLARGGAETMLLKLLQNINRQQYEPIVISLLNIDNLAPRIEALGIPVYGLGIRLKMPNPFKLIKLLRLIHKLKPDIVHTWLYYSDFLGGCSARLLGHQKIIWCIRHSNLEKRQNNLFLRNIIRVNAFLSKRIPQKIISCSKKAEEIHIKIGYSKKKFAIIPNGFELEQFQSIPNSKDKVYKELQLPLNSLLVGLIARYVPIKNHEGFLEAASIIHQQKPHVHFILAGLEVTHQNQRLKQLIQSYKLEKNVHLLGPREDIPLLMSALDVLASTSHGEGFPNVIGEAMACETPCVVTDVGDSADIVGDTGRIVSAGDMSTLAKEVLALLQMPEEERKALGKKARKRVQENYEIKYIAGLYEKVYEEVLKNK